MVAAQKERSHLLQAESRVVTQANLHLLIECRACLWWSAIVVNAVDRKKNAQAAAEEMCPPAESPGVCEIQADMSASPHRMANGPRDVCCVLCCLMRAERKVPSSPGRISCGDPGKSASTHRMSRMFVVVCVCAVTVALAAVKNDAGCGNAVC